MYENQTFEIIINRLLSRIPDTFDRREGSIIYDTLAPFAKELEKAYIALDTIITEAFPITSSREYLLLNALGYYMSPYEATHAVHIAECIFYDENKEVEIGSRFSQNTLTFETIQNLGNNQYLLRCEQAGELGNDAYGIILPIANVNGLKSAKIIGLSIPGTDEESTESFRERFSSKFGEEAFGGNYQDYKNKVNALQGVGGCKIIRCPNDEVTKVDVVIIDSQFNKPNKDVIDYVQETLHPLLPDYTEPVIENSGVGLTPIGHVVTVKPVEEVSLDITLHLDYMEGSNYGTLGSQIEEAIEQYLLEECRKKWARTDYIIVRISGIENAVLNVDGVIDIRDTEINGSLENISLDKYEIPILKTVKDVGI